MFQILVNNQEVQLGQPCPQVTSVKITIHPGLIMQVPKGQKELIAAWLYDITQRCENYIMYNGALMNPDQVKSPEEIFKGN